MINNQTLNVYLLNHCQKSVVTRVKYLKMRIVLIPSDLSLVVGMHRSIRCSIRGWLPFTKKGETGGQTGTKEMTLEQRVSRPPLSSD